MSLRGRHVRTSVAPTCRFLVITVGGVCFALLADHIQGLLTADEAASGETLDIQGNVYPKMDLAGRLKLSRDPEGPERRIVLFSTGHLRAHIPVTQVHGLQESPQSEILPLPRQFHGEERKWYDGMILIDQGVALILKSAWVLEGYETGAGMSVQPGKHVVSAALAGGRATC